MAEKKYDTPRKWDLFEQTIQQFEEKDKEKKNNNNNKSGKKKENKKDNDEQLIQQEYLLKKSLEYRTKYEQKHREEVLKHLEPEVEVHHSKR